jgi:CubicO group peptidase (beta-lactamase class C family)
MDESSDCLFRILQRYNQSLIPTYSSIAYQLLAYALENITGKSFPMILYKRILTPLNLTNTYYWVANESLDIVPGTASSTSWKVYLGDASP